MVIQVSASDAPANDERILYDRLHKLIVDGKLDSVKNIVETYSVDLSKYDNDERYTPIIHTAVKRRNIELIQYLIENGASVNARTSSGETALHLAASKDSDIVKLLIEKGADVNAIYDSNGDRLSPLCCAAESSSIEAAKYLIEKGADIKGLNEDCASSLLRLAAYDAEYDIFLLLARQQPKTYDWQKALFYGIKGGNLDIVKYIAKKKGVKVKAYSDFWRASPIGEAVKVRLTSENQQPLEVVKYLISKGARLTDINGGHNIFDWAIRNDLSDDMMVFLVEQGIDVSDSEVRTQSGEWTPLVMALDELKLDLARLLLKKTNNHTFRGLPLVVFFADGRYDSATIISILIDEGVNKDYYTEAFVKSVTLDDWLSVQFLLDAGADISTTIAVETNGVYEGDCDMLHYAKNYEVAKTLIDRGADVHNKIMLENAWKNPPLLLALETVGIYPPMSQDNLNTHLSYAAELGDIRTLEYMLKRGADVNYSQPPTALDDKSKTGLTVYNQTPLIKNSTRGYKYHNVLEHVDKNGKQQVLHHIAEILLNAGADPDIADYKGRTALHYTAGEFRIAGFKNSNTHSRRESEGWHWDPPRSKLYHDSIANLLIQNGANLNIQDSDGSTPLILAAKNNKYGVLEMLLAAQADITIKDNQGGDVFYYCDDMEAFSIIKEAGLWEEYIEKNQVKMKNKNLFEVICNADYFLPKGFNPLGS